MVTRSVRDAAAVLEWVADPPPGEPYYAPDRTRRYTDEVGEEPGRLRIGLMTRPPGGQFEAHPDCVAGAEATARLLESVGHGVEAAYPQALDDPGYIEKFLVRWTSGVDFNLRYWERRTGQSIGPDDVEPVTWALADQGRSHSAAAYLEAMEYAQAVARDGANWWAEYDLLLTPTMANHHRLKLETIMSSFTGLGAFPARDCFHALTRKASEMTTAAAIQAWRKK